MDLDYRYVAAGVFALWLSWTFNTLIARRNQVRFAGAAIDAYLKKRFDLIPNLVSVCETYLAHERTVLTDLTRLRREGVEALQRGDRAPDGPMRLGLQRLMAVAEAYPVLVSQQNFVLLQHSLNEVEEQLAAARRAFNAAVTDFNTTRERFPANLVALLLGFAPAQVFEITEAERAPVAVWRKTP